MKIIKTVYEELNSKIKRTTYKKNKIDIDTFKKDDKELIKDNKLILKTQQRFKSEIQQVFTKEISKITLSSNDDKRMKTIDSIKNMCPWNEERCSK